MGVLTFDALLRSVKKGVADPVYYLHGDEDVLKDEAIRSLCETALDPAARDFNFDQRSAGETGAEALYALLNTPPLLAERRVVVLRGVEAMRKKSKARDELARYLADPNPATILVLVQSAGEAPDSDLASRATSVQMDRLPPERVARWAAHHARSLGITLEPAAADLLIAATGDSLGVLAKEIEKLAGLAPSTGEPITRDQVAALVGVRHGETVHDLVDAVLDGEPARAARLVRPVLEQGGMTGVRVVTALGTALVGTALARAELDRGTPRARLTDAVFRHLLALRPFGLRSWKEEAGRWARWAERWPAPALSSALRLALEADRALKGSRLSDDHGIVTQLVLTLGMPARGVA